MAGAVKATKGRAQKLRLMVQVFFFALVALTATMNGLKESGIEVPDLGSASLHAICPFGGVVSFWQLVSAGNLPKKAHESSVVLAVIGIALAVLAGPVICGWVCPFGSVQEWLGKLGKRIFKKRYNTFVPARLDKALRYLRYLVLVLVSYMTIMTDKLAFESMDPYYALFNFWRSEVAVGSLVALGVVILLSLFVERPFCKYACPYGAFQGLFNLVRIFGIKRNATTCISCNACSRACPMNIEVATAGTVRDHQCITCMKCTSEAACPVPQTVELAAGGFPAAAGAAPKAPTATGAAKEASK
jgi:polyferredoxin